MKIYIILLKLFSIILIIEFFKAISSRSYFDIVFIIILFLIINLGPMFTEKVMKGGKKYEK